MWRNLALLFVCATAGEVRVSPILFSGTPDPVKVLSASQSAKFTHLLGNYTTPGRTSVTAGYRGFRVDGLLDQTTVLWSIYVRGAPDLEMFLLSLFALPPAVTDYVKGEINRDHTGELNLPDYSMPSSRGANCSHAVGPDVVPTYDPEHDNGGCFVSHQGDNNCYNYGTDISTDTFAQPGRGSGHKWTANTCEAIRTAAEHDGLVWFGTTLPTKAPQTGHYVAMLIWPDTNFHWIRMDKSGNWSHKPGGTPVRNTDNNGHKITDPSKADFSPWTQFCGYLHVVPSTVASNIGSATILV